MKYIHKTYNDKLGGQYFLFVQNVTTIYDRGKMIIGRYISIRYIKDKISLIVQ